MSQDNVQEGRDAVFGMNRLSGRVRVIHQKLQHSFPFLSLQEHKQSGEIDKLVVVVIVIAVIVIAFVIIIIAVLLVGVVVIPISINSNTNINININISGNGSSSAFVTFQLLLWYVLLLSAANFVLGGVENFVTVVVVVIAFVTVTAFVVLCLCFCWRQ